MRVRLGRPPAELARNAPVPVARPSPSEPIRLVIGDHALCRHCGHVVRVDWETCFHCGIRNPAPRSLSGSGLRTTTVLVLLCLGMAAGLNVAAVWNVVRSAPGRIVEVATQTPRVVAPMTPVPASPGTGDVEPGSTAPVPQVATATPDLSAPADAPSIALGRPAMPGTALAITVRPGECVGALPADGAAIYALESPAIGQAIATCRSVAELDSLETRLRADHPGDPALRRGGSVQRRLDARRAVLAQP